MIDWKISPLVGVGPLQFGMSPEDVAKILGPAEKTHKVDDDFIGLPALQKKFSKDTVEYRMFGDVKTMLPTISYRAGKLNHIGFEKNHNTLSLEGTKLFKTDRKKVIDTITGMCKNVLITDNHYTIYFMDVGIKMANVKQSKIEPTICVWSGDLFDDLYTDPNYLTIKGKP
jgi:hypothetical protein